MAPGVVFMYVHLSADKTNRKHFSNFVSYSMTKSGIFIKNNNDIFQVMALVT